MNEDDVCFALDQHTGLNLYSASSLKQQSAGKHVAQLRHIILILSQPVFPLKVLCLEEKQQQTRGSGEPVSLT